MESLFDALRAVTVPSCARASEVRSNALESVRPVPTSQDSRVGPTAGGTHAWELVTWTTGIGSWELILTLPLGQA